MSRDSLTVACVLRSGGPYDESYVERLWDGVDKHLPGVPFVCLSDTPLKCPWVPLATEWPRNWAKLELFTPGLFTGRVLYLDLDTDVIGDLSDIAAIDCDFGMLTDWIRPGRGASGVMLWRETAATRDLYFTFQRNPALAESYRFDQRYIDEGMGGVFRDLRAAVPGQIVSRWVECRREVPDNARLICWHGEPRPDTIGWRTHGDDSLRDPRWWALVERMGYR